VRKFTDAEKAEVWDRWQGGEAMRSIARRLGRESSSVRRSYGLAQINHFRSITRTSPSAR
jgi:transposase-like protein